MQRNLAALVLLAATACGSQSPAGLKLIFASDADQMAAAYAIVYVIDANAATAQSCSTLTAFPQPMPDPVLQTINVTLNQGMPVAGMSKLKAISTGNRTLLVQIQDAAMKLTQIGCFSGELKSNKTAEVDLTTVEAPDLAKPLDMTVDLVSPPDMAAHNTLAITVNELRAPTRKIQNAAVTITDSASAASATVMTGADGIAKIDTVGLVAPFRVTAVAPVSNGFSGAASVAGISPTFTNDAGALTLPVELDPPTGTSAITATVSDAAAGATLHLYWQNASGIPSDVGTKAVTGPSAHTTDPLIDGAIYRLAILTDDHLKIYSPVPPLGSSGSSTSTLATDFKSAGFTFTPTLVYSTDQTDYVTQEWSVLIVLLASGSAQEPIPLKDPTAFTASGPATGVMVPAMAATVQTGAVLMPVMTANGPTSHGELRRQLSATTPVTDSFQGAVPNPPGVPTPAVTPAASPLTIVATPPTGIALGSTFVHVTVTNAAQTFHMHLLMPAANPSNIVIPGGILAAGMYNADVAFVQNFTLPDATVSATIADDWTKLIRSLPAMLTQTTVTLTTN